jgi:HAD superfamily hydrolase (TIGR01509 family)
MTIDAVLLDSGGVMVRPIGGRWNPRFDFEETVRRHLPDHPLDRLAAAIASGDRFLDEGPADRPRVEYHRHLLQALGIDNPTPVLLDDLDRPLDFHEIVEVYDDVRPTLHALRRGGIRLAVVSDAGPELERAYVELGLAGAFETFAISANVGATKPDPRMYETARLGVGGPPAERCLFVDDDPALVASAIELGYQGVALTRSPRSDGLVPVITTLHELVDLVLD